MTNVASLSAFLLACTLTIGCDESQKDDAEAASNKESAGGTSVDAAPAAVAEPVAVTFDREKAREMAKGMTKQSGKGELEATATAIYRMGPEVIKPMMFEILDLDAGSISVREQGFEEEAKALERAALHLIGYVLRPFGRQSNEALKDLAVHVELPSLRVNVCEVLKENGEDCPAPE